MGRELGFESLHKVGQQALQSRLHFKGSHGDGDGYALDVGIVEGDEIPHTGGEARLDGLAQFPGLFR